MRIKGLRSFRRGKDSSDFKESDYSEGNNYGDTPKRPISEKEKISNEASLDSLSRTSSSSPSSFSSSSSSSTTTSTSTSTSTSVSSSPSTSQSGKIFPDVLGTLSKLTGVVTKSNQDKNPDELPKALREEKEALSKIEVVAFIGSSGTGKSTRAIKLARDLGIEYIIDDGLLINGSRVAAGLSAKRAESRLESVRQALFMDENRVDMMRKALIDHSPDKLMILGTSDGMLEKICDNLWLNRPSKIVRIEDVTTEEERRRAVYIRSTQGRHTIPVPSMEIKHEFSGYFSDPISRIFRRRGKTGSSADTEKDYVSSDRTVVRPTFSSLGSYSISSGALKDIATIILRRRVKGVSEILKFDVDKESYGIIIYMEISLLYGYNAQEVLQDAQIKVATGIEDLTAMNVLMVNVKARKVVRETVRE